MTAVAIEFAALFLFWLMLSGRFQAKYLIIGAFAAALVTFFTNDLLYDLRLTSRKTVWDTRTTLLSALRLLRYSGWLVVAIVKANIQVASLVLGPRGKIDPGFLKFDTGLKAKVSRVTLANSITLTPGTITVEQKSGVFIVHALAKDTAGDLESGLMQEKIGTIFCEKPTKATCRWAHSIKEIRG